MTNLPVVDAIVSTYKYLYAANLEPFGKSRQSRLLLTTHGLEAVALHLTLEGVQSAVLLATMSANFVLRLRVSRMSLKH